MKLSWNCGLPFKAWWVSTVVFDILMSFVVGAMSVWVLTMEVGSQVQLLYTPSPDVNYIERNDRYTDVVTSWVLTVLITLCVARTISATILAAGVKKSSPGLAKVWMGFKVFSVMMSFFLLTVSFNVSVYSRLAAGISLLTDITTSYFIKILYPELDRMRKMIFVCTLPARNVNAHE